MFSSLVSFMKNKKRNKKNKTEERNRVSSTVSFAEEASDVLGRERSTLSVESGIYPPLLSPQTATLTLLKGSSESKPVEDKKASPELGAPTLTPRKNVNRLYPDLQVSEASTSKEILVVKKSEKKLKKIHDFGEEIPCIIEPSISNAKIKIMGTKQLKSEIEKKLLAIMTAITNPPKLDYDFNSELKVIENSPDDIKTYKYYKNIQTFSELKYYRINSKENKKRNATSKNIRDKETIKTPVIFQSYSKAFKCYRGKSNDLVYCP